MSDDDDKQIARRKVRSTLDDMLEARRDYQYHVNLGRASQANEEALHANLQTAVMTAWEALRPYAVGSSQRKVRHLWDDAQLWPVERQVEYVPICPACREQRAGLEAGDVCPECDGPIEYQQLPVRDADGQIQYKYAEGLGTLAEYQGQTEETVERTGTFSPQQRVVERPVRLRPEYLFRAARLLDELAEQLNIIGEEANPVADVHEQGEV
jgi:hypothetical protein